ncbi:MAG: hypothetical protein LUH00_05495 [Lachnospiraceae bacterium]|nr:hypothetical protein [Lachnospiraceae bacterium]
MLQFLMEKNVLLYALAAACVLGVVSQVILRRIYDGLLGEVRNTGTAEGRFLQQLRQRFQYCTHLSERVGDVHALIQKSMLEYRVWGMSLHSWERIGGGCLVVSLLCAFAGSAVRAQSGAAIVDGNVYFWLGIGAVVLTALAYGLADIGYRSRSLEICLSDFLENGGVSGSYSGEEELPEMEYEAESRGGASLRGAKAAAAARTPIVPVSEGRRSRRLAKAETAASLESARRTKKNTKGMQGKESEPARGAREMSDLKENLARAKAGMQEAAVSDEEHSASDRAGQMLRQMDEKEQERLIRAVLTEFLSQ